MSHWIIVPVLLPAFTAVYLLVWARRSLMTQRAVSLLSTIALVGVGVALLVEAQGGGFGVYALGDWQAPYGIVLVLDRLSALMVLLLSLLAVSALLFAIHGWDQRGKNFHALFQFQLMGLNGAFLTGDVFNLFVFFEVLLIASYGLLLHGGGEERVRAGFHYVVFNLAASALFLVALALLYGTLGTLNMADLALRVSALAPEDAALVRVAALLLLVVFAAKAAVLPLYFWLPQAYASASPPVAALFAIMTKVGVYAILRVFLIVFGAQAGALANVAAPVLFVGGLLTLAFATIGVVASGRLRRQAAYLVVASVGTLLVAIGLSTADAVAAALYYLVHSTVALAALFLLVELVSGQRGSVADRLAPGPPLVQPALLGAGFLVAALAVVGMPPLSGFLGKTMILRGAIEAPGTAWVFAVVLTTSLLSTVALVRAGSLVFWKAEAPPEGSPLPAGPGTLLPVAGLLALTALLVIAAGPLHAYLEGAAAQLVDPAGYVESVLGTEGAE